MAIDYQDMLEIFLHRMLYPIVHNVAYDLYRQHQNKQPMDGFHKKYREAERFGTTDRVYRRAVKALTDAGLVTRTKQGLEIRIWMGCVNFSAMTSLTDTPTLVNRTLVCHFGAIRTYR